MKYPDFAQRFNDAVAHAVQSRGVIDTQEALARLFKVSGVTIWSYRNGEKMPRMAMAVRIAAELGVNVTWLLSGSGGMLDHEESVAAPLHQQLTENLKGKATPTSREILLRLAKAAETGRLSEDDLRLLDQIASRIENASQKPQP